MSKKVDVIKHELNPMSLMSLVLSIVSLAIVTSLIFIPKTDDVYTLLFGIDTFICLFFWFQLLTDLFRSKQKWAYLKVHWIDFVASLPIIEQVRFARVIQVFRVMRLIRSSNQILHYIRSNRREATVASIFLLLTLLVTVGSALMLMIEGDIPESNIHNASDALWWVFVTISTVGYGDHYPVTTLGKILAAVIIVCGVGLFGMVAGLVSSMISDPGKLKHEKEQEHLHQQEWKQMLDIQQQLLMRLEQLENRLPPHQNTADTEMPKTVTDVRHPKES
ncbi:potassium channel family protein [Photobacterium sanguinicancri]|uniref:Capsular biosynthesis protein n=1 Tax=Photobacterium sanguinicancri TaxID=875932 RepID=A0AAW7Y5C2_9GAMM|nr:potassium channel family protein [Photobacterium sanguinicancri]MDO6543642.1 potassium channel family protein [Photobacterium sanguinicancri]OZS45353.1 capsular biosynthesis protein [Photobacterium sanguinicancri]